MNRSTDDGPHSFVGRRRFLYLLGAAGAAAVIGVGLVLKRARNDEPAAALLALLDDLDTARTLGLARVAGNPDESRPAELIEHLRRDLGLQSRSVAPQELRRRVAERIRSDYSAGLVGEIGNWTLSDTEIRLCVLAAVTTSGRSTPPR